MPVSAHAVVGDILSATEDESLGAIFFVARGNPSAAAHDARVVMQGILESMGRSALADSLPIVENSSGATIDLASTSPRMAAYMIKELAEVLSEIGWSGHLTADPPAEQPPRLPDPAVAAVTAGLALDLDAAQVAAIDEQMPGRRWLATASATERVVGSAVSWATREAGHVTTSEMNKLTPVSDSSQAEAFLLSAISESQRVNHGVECIGVDWFRRASFGPFGHVILESGGRIEQWETQVLGLVNQLRILADTLRYALVKRTTAPRGSMENLVCGPGPQPAVQSNYIRRAPWIESRLVPDAYGVQLLGPEHPELWTSTDLWSVERIGSNRLVSAIDLNAWFSNPLPSPRTLAEARGSMEGMLMRLDSPTQYRHWTPAETAGPA